MKQTGTGNLFAETAHERFIRLTGQRYKAMAERLKRKGWPSCPFTLDEAREHVLKALGGHEDGFLRCRYCQGFFGLHDIAADHEKPLSKGGSPGLDNIGYPCKQCNAAKGSTTPEDFEKLIHFLENEIPLARVDILSRLAMSVQLAAGQRANAGIVEELKESGAWQKVAKARREAKRVKESGLGKF